MACYAKLACDCTLLFIIKELLELSNKAALEREGRGISPNRGHQDILVSFGRRGFNTYCRPMYSVYCYIAVRS